MRLFFLFIFVMAAGSGLRLWAQEQNGSLSGGESSYQDGGKRDPFLPLVDENGNIVLYDSELIQSDLKIEGIMWSSDPAKSVAIVNGRIVKIHDVIGAFEVDKILKDRILFRKNQEIIELILKKE